MKFPGMRNVTVFAFRSSLPQRKLKIIKKQAAK